MWSCNQQCRLNWNIKFSIWWDLDGSVPLTKSLANCVKIDGGIISVDLSRCALILVSMHRNSEDFYLNGALVCKVRTETQTVSNNYSTSKKKERCTYLLSLKQFSMIYTGSASWKVTLQAFLVNKTSKMWNTQKTEADPLIAAKDEYTVLLLACSALDLEPQTSSESWTSSQL